MTPLVILDAERMHAAYTQVLGVFHPGRNDHRVWSSTSSSIIITVVNGHFLVLKGAHCEKERYPIATRSVARQVVLADILVRSLAANIFNTTMRRLLINTSCAIKLQEESRLFLIHDVFRYCKSVEVNTILIKQDTCTLVMFKEEALAR